MVLLFSSLWVVCSVTLWCGSHAMPPSLLQPEPSSPPQVTADPWLHRRDSNTQRQVWLSLLWGLWVLVHTRFCLSPPSISEHTPVGMGFDSKRDFIPPTILLGLLLCPWKWGIFFFLVGSNILLLMVVQQLVAIWEFSQKMTACPSTLPSCGFKIKQVNPKGNQS